MRIQMMTTEEANMFADALESREGKVLGMQVVQTAGGAVTVAVTYEDALPEVTENMYLVTAQVNAGIHVMMGRIEQQRAALSAAVRRVTLQGAGRIMGFDSRPVLDDDKDTKAWTYAYTIFLPADAVDLMRKAVEPYQGTVDPVRPEPHTEDEGGSERPHL